MHECSAASIVSSSLRPHKLQPTRLLCPQDSPNKNTGVGCHSLLQGIFPTQGSNPHLLCLPHWQAGSLLLAPSGKPKEWEAYGLNLTLPRYSGLWEVFPHFWTSVSSTGSNGSGLIDVCCSWSESSWFGKALPPLTGLRGELASKYSILHLCCQPLLSAWLFCLLYLKREWIRR